MRVRLAAAPGYCCEHWRDVCACRTGCSGSLLLIVAIGVTIWLCRNREQRRADGKTNVGGGRLPDYCVPAECRLPGVLCPVDNQRLYRGIRNGGLITTGRRSRKVRLLGVWITALAVYRNLSSQLMA